MRVAADRHIGTVIDCIDLFGYRAPVAIPAEIYPDYLHYLEARSRMAEADPAVAEVSEA